MKPDPHLITFNSPFNLWRREIAVQAAQPLVAARIAKIGAPQGILAEACDGEASTAAPASTTPPSD